MRRRTPRFLLLGLLLFPLVTHSQTPEATLPVGTPLPVRIDDHLPMRAGVPVRAELIYPVYVDNKLILPAKTILNGTVTDLRSDHSRRVRARINGDFTPFHIPVVRFTQITLADGTTLPLTAGTATDGAPIFRLVAPPPRKGGFIRQQWDAGMQIVHDQIAVLTAPEKGDRLLQLLYHQLPYHPERIEKETAWTVETIEPVVIPAQSAGASAERAVDQASPAAPGTAQTRPDSGPPTWTIQAYLDEALNSADAKTGQQVKATVAEPIYNADHTIAVPQGATLVGAVTQAKPARSFARAGVLRFDFRQIVLPTGQSQTVQAQLTGADSASPDKLAMNSEGQVKPKPQDKIVVPLILGLLAGQTLDVDRGDSVAGKNFVGANGFGLAGNLIGLAGSSKVAAGIGFYGTAVAFYFRWIAPGRQVVFAKDTRIVLQTMARRAALKPAVQ